MPSCIHFGTKAETLERLKKRVTKSSIETLYRFSVKEWHGRSPAIIQRVQKHFVDCEVIIRSSAATEDVVDGSNAGRFISVPEVSVRNQADFINAVDRVIASYKDSRLDHQVFVQKFIRDVEMSGVVFTRDKDTLAPYMTFNIDDTSGRTDLITSGKSVSHKTLVVHRDYGHKIQDTRIRKIYECVLEVEKLMRSDSLDIEFCYKRGKVQILQVRPIALKKKMSSRNGHALTQTLAQINEKIRELSRPHPHLHGKRTVYGVMPDWNPAEMVGIKPRPLALSLYKELITDSIWAYQRDNYGYKNLRSFPLIMSFAGHPYVDVRVDFNSWIPKGLNHKLSQKLVDFYIEKLVANPTSHDKVEFDIVYSCYTFDLEPRLQELRKYGFSSVDLGELKQALLGLTNAVIAPDGLYKKDYEKVVELEKRREEILAAPLSEMSKIYWLIEDCKRYGTLPFAGLARAAFIATQFLNSMVGLGIMSQEEREAFMKSLNTIAKQLSRDSVQLAQEKISLEEFLRVYGHLRPGTYDILSESYEENPYRYFDLNRAKHLSGKPVEAVDFSFSAEQMKQIARMLDEHRMATNADEFVAFLRTSIEGREYAKFVFTKSIHAVLKLMKSYGKSFDFNADDMSFMEIGTILKLYSSVAGADEKILLKEEIQRNRGMWTLFQPVKLPLLISQPDDVYCFYASTVEPNYVTLGKVSAAPCVVNHDAVQSQNVEGAIVFIESADPGFDWIFSRGIKGLVTMYGGANSHMAVRASELSIPAVIGCGEANFAEWKAAQRLEIDCLNKQVKILS